MRFITRFTDSLVARLVPAATVRASCEPDTVCDQWCVGGTRRCCAIHQDCTKSCYWGGC